MPICNGPEKGRTGLRERVRYTAGVLALSLALSAFLVALMLFLAVKGG